MRPVTLHEKPPFPPYVCVYCGIGTSPRKWFIDPGMSLDYYFNPVQDGSIFICNECWGNLRIQVERLINVYAEEHAAWDSPDRVSPTYVWKQAKPEDRHPVGELIEAREQTEGVTNDVRGSESTVGEPVPKGNVSFGTTVVDESERDDSNAEQDDSGLESDDTESDADTDKQAFKAIFGNEPTG